MTLYAHQSKGVAWLSQKQSAGLFWEMGCGKSRTALEAARKLYEARKIDRVLVLAPAAVRFAWREELSKLGLEGFDHNLLRYDAKKQVFFVEQVGGNLNGKQHLPIALVSYSLLPQKRHADALEKWCRDGDAVLICDESSFLKSRTAKQTKAAMKIAGRSCYRWLLSGTPICNSPLDLYAQAKVMSPANGPLGAYSNFYHFQASIGDLIPVIAKNGKPLRVVGRGANGRVGFQIVKRWESRPEGLEKLQKLFAPYVSRVEKRDCLDLPAKTYTVREVALSEETWRIYQELKREAMLALSADDVRPEPNAAVRILRLCQLTSGHVGTVQAMNEFGAEESVGHDTSSEKLDYLTDSILGGELQHGRALIIWCRWKRERERLAEMIKNKINVYEIFGGQSQAIRDGQLTEFQGINSWRRVLLAQPHAGGFGLNLTAASTAVYLSNDFSYSTRVQSEDRCHRIGQTNPVTYVDVVAVGPKGQRTVDHHILEALRAKKSVADFTCSAWRRALED